MRRAISLGAPIGLLAVLAIAGSQPGEASAEQASQPTQPAAGGIDAGGFHSCARLTTAALRCWGFGADGQLGYGNTNSVGDDETPAAAGPVNLGPRTVTAIATGDAHTCALLDNGSVRCWGFGGNGRLGYGNTNNVLDPSTVGAVDLTGANLVPHTAVAITAGRAHTCAILNDGSVRCWGFAGGAGFPDSPLGYGNNDDIGDNEPPGPAGPVNLGLGRTALAISAGAAHTCALLDDYRVRCWGRGDDGRLGYGSVDDIGGSDPSTIPADAGPVDLGTGPGAVPHTARAISAGDAHTCVLLEDATVRCWGQGGSGQLGYGNTNNIGDNESPATAGAVNLGLGPGAVPHTAKAISAGGAHTCAVLDDASVRCWGYGGNGRLGYGNTTNIGDNELPGSVGPVDLGTGRTAAAISAGSIHTCARLDNGTVRCWGYGLSGRLGYCNQLSVGDDELPGSVGPVNLEPGDGGRCGPPPVPVPVPVPASITTPAAEGEAGASAPTLPGGSTSTPDAAAAALAAEKLRAKALRRCLARAGRSRRDRRRCLKRYGRTPGRVSALAAQASGRGSIELTFKAAGTDHANPPAARNYLVKQSLRRDLRGADALCRGSCDFRVSVVGAEITLTIDHLQANTTYYYAVAARDNVSDRLGPRSAAVRARTR